MTIGLLLGAIAILLGALTYQTFKKRPIPIPIPTPKITSNRGVIQRVVLWRHRENDKYPWQDMSAKITFIVERLDQVASRTKIKVLDMCGTDEPFAINLARTELGIWVPTKDIEWDTTTPSQPETPKKLSSDELVELVLKDNIETPLKKDTIKRLAQQESEHVDSGT